MVRSYRYAKEAWLPGHYLSFRSGDLLTLDNGQSLAPSGCGACIPVDGSIDRGSLTRAKEDRQAQKKIDARLAQSPCLGYCPACPGMAPSCPSQALSCLALAILPPARPGPSAAFPGWARFSQPSATVIDPRGLPVRRWCSWPRRAGRHGGTRAAFSRRHPRAYRPQIWADTP